jgi:hypothetical protein
MSGKQSGTNGQGNTYTSYGNGKYSYSNSDGGKYFSAGNAAFYKAPEGGGKYYQVRALIFCYFFFLHNEEQQWSVEPTRQQEINNFELPRTRQSACSMEVQLNVFL